MNTDSINDYLLHHLTERRLRHTEGVKQTAVHLAKRWGADPEKAALCALFHDMFKCRTVEEEDRAIDHYGIDSRYKGNPNLAHSKLAAAAMQQDWQITDPEMLNAVAYHTTGRAGMGLLEKIIYLADAIEPGRQYPGVEVLRRLAEINLNRACLVSMERTMQYVKDNGEPLDRDTAAAVKELNATEEIMNSREQAMAAAKAIDDRRGTNIMILDITEHAAFADFLVLGSGGSERQIAALADEVEDALAKEGILVKQIEGKKESGWILMDYGDIIVHLMTEKMRSRYRIEAIWGDCPSVPVAFTKEKGTEK